MAIRFCFEPFFVGRTKSSRESSVVALTRLASTGADLKVPSVKQDNYHGARGFLSSVSLEEKHLLSGFLLVWRL